MKYMRITSFIFVVALLGVGIVYLANNISVNTPIKSNDSANNNTETTSSSEKSLPITDTSVIYKINVYVNAMNSESGRVVESYNRYCSWLKNPEIGPTGKEETIYGLYNIYEVQDFIAVMDLCEKNGPEISGIDKKIKPYKIALKNMYNVLFEVNYYYEQENYKDDNMAKGKEMHKGLMEAFDNYFEADKNLRAEITKWYVQYDSEEKEIKNTYYFLSCKELMMDAEKMVTQMHLNDVKQVQEIDVKLFNENIKVFESAYLKLSRMETSGMNELVKPIFNFYLMRASDFLSASKALMRRVRDRILYSESELDSRCWIVSGSHWGMIEHYNDLIDSFNNIKEYKNDDIFNEIPHCLRLHILPCFDVPLK